MSFVSQHAPRIWEDLYGVYIPDFVTRSKENLRTYGTPSSGDKEIDKMMATNTVYVKIPIIQIAEYFDNGLEVQVPVREDMIAMHKSIELYLQEWREDLIYSLNTSGAQHKKLLLSLERLSRLIYNKAHVKEVVSRLFVGSHQTGGFGLSTAMAHTLKEEQERKPDYSSISELLKPAVRRMR